MDTGFGLGKAFYEINSEEADWESGSDFEGGNKGHRPRIKGVYSRIIFKTYLVLCIKHLNLCIT
jgi:hypothetical protein